MSKQKLFLDFDGVIADSIQAFCDTYNILYQERIGFSPARWAYVEKWNFIDECPLLHGNQQKINHIFETGLFFERLQFMDDSTERVIHRLCSKYEVITVTIGTPLNIARKALWLRDKLPCIKNHIFLTRNDTAMGKGVIDMQNSIQIDDHVDNLDSTNAEYKIVFGDVYDWNRGSSYTRAFTWEDIEGLLL